MIWPANTTPSLGPPQPAKLARDLPYYSVGLFPLFANASMQIRPKIIDLFNMFYLPLGENLLPCLTGFVMASVPGLEETNSEFYRSIVKLLEQVKVKVGAENLYHSLWKIISLNPSIRIGAINFLMETLPKSSKIDKAQFMPNTSTLVLNAMIRAIDDPVVLVQRSVLDLLLAHFRLGEQIFTVDENAALMKKTLLLLLRREASLNRRVYTWMLGEDASQQSAYFARNAKQSLVLALKSLFADSTSSHTSLEKAIIPFKILLALFDKPEVSAPIINEVLETIFIALHKFCDSSYSFTAEIIAQANTVLDGLRPSIIWQFINQFVREDVQKIVSGLNSEILNSEIEPNLSENDATASTSSPPPPPSNRGNNSRPSSSPHAPTPSSRTSLPNNVSSSSKALILCNTILDKMIGLNTQEAITIHLPEFIASLTHCASISAKDSQHHDITLHCLTLILKVVGKMQQPISRPAASSSRPGTPSNTSPSTMDSVPLTASIGAPVTNSEGLPSPALIASIAALESFYRDICTTYLPMQWKLEVDEALKAAPPTSVVSSRHHVVFGPTSSNVASPGAQIALHWNRTLATSIHAICGEILILAFSSEVFNLEAPDPTKKALPEWFDANVKLTESQHPIVACNSIRVLARFLALPSSNLSASKLHGYIMHSTRIPHTLAKRMWELLAPRSSIVHYQVAALFLELRPVMSDIIEDIICEALLNREISLRLEALQRFALLWRLTGELGASRTFDRALFLMLDSLNDEQPIIKLACRTWLADSITKVERILDPLLLVLLDPKTSRTPNGFYATEYDCRRVLYALKVLQSIIECDFKLWMQNAMNRVVSRDMLLLHRQQVIQEQTPASNFVPSDAASSPTKEESGKTGSSNLASYVPPVPSAEPLSQVPLYASDAFSHIPVETYLDLLVVQSLRFIIGTPSRNATVDFAAKNSVVQTTAVGFLQFMVVKMQTTSKAADLALILHQPILEALAQAVSDAHLILQVNLLGLIRSLILIDTSATNLQRQAVNTGNTAPAAQAQPVANSTRVVDAIGQSQLFLQTINIGLLQTNADFNIRFYWLDFVTSTFPHLSKYAHMLMAPILQCLCDIISTHKNAYDSIESKDSLMILRAMKMILQHAVHISPQDPIILRDPSTGNDSAFSTTMTISTSSQSNNAQSGSGFSSFFKTLFVSEAGGPASGAAGSGKSPATLSAIESILERLDIILKGLLKVWGSGTTSFKSMFSEFGPNLCSENLENSFASPLDSLSSLGYGLRSEKVSSASKNANVMDKDAWTSDEVHNRYLVQDQLLAILELLYHASPSKFLDCILKDWVYIARHPEQLMGANAPKLPAFDSGFDSEAMKQALRHKSLALNIINHMSNVTGESLYKALTEVLRACHTSDNVRSLRLAQAKKRGVNYTHLQDACIAEFGVLIADWGNTNKISEQTLPSVVQFIRALLTSHNPQAICQSWKLLECVFTRLFGASSTSSSSIGGGNGGHNQHGDSASKNHDSASKTSNAGSTTANNQSATAVPSLMQQARVKKEVLAVVQLLCESSQHCLNKTFVDLSCSWKVVTAYRVVFDEKTEPVVMDESAQLSIRTLVALQMTLYLREHLMPVAERLPEDAKVALTASSFAPMIVQLSTTLQADSMKAPTLAQESAALMERFAAAPHVCDPKVWRKAALDVFLWWNDFLRVSGASTLKCFQRIVSHLFTAKYDSDGNAWAEFVKYVSKAVAPQTIIFASGAESAAQRALAVRRLAFIILSGIQDQFLDQLPWIQEKLVEALKQRDAHSDTFSAVFLCLRVLLIKLKPESLRSFWPAIISEMLTVFTPTLVTPSSGDKAAVLSSPDPELVFAVTKFLDLLFMLPSEQFNIHEWIFISDPLSSAGRAVSNEKLEKAFPEKNWAFIPYIDRVSARPFKIASASSSSFTSSGNFSLMDDFGGRKKLCTSSVVQIQKLDANPTPTGMTWEQFVSWLSRYSDYQYDNRVATQSFAKTDDIANMILADFSALQSRGLDPSDWTMLRVSSASSPVSSDLGASSSTASTTAATRPRNFSASSPTTLSPASSTTNASTASVATSSGGSNSSTPVMSTTPIPPTSTTPTPLALTLDPEDNANATLFGDVLD